MQGGKPSGGGWRRTRLLRQPRERTGEVRIVGGGRRVRLGQSGQQPRKQPQCRQRGAVQHGAPRDAAVRHGAAMLRGVRGGVLMRAWDGAWDGPWDGPWYGAFLANGDHARPAGRADDGGGTEDWGSPCPAGATGSGERRRGNQRLKDEQGRCEQRNPSSCSSGASVHRIPLTAQMVARIRPRIRPASRDLHRPLTHIKRVWPPSIATRRSRGTRRGSRP